MTPNQYRQKLFFLLFYAYLAKELAYEFDNMFIKTTLQLSRHMVHIGLILCWMVSISRRILQKSIRHYLLAVGGLLTFWLYIRTVKWMFFPNNCWQSRYCWYAYYIPLILTPLFGVFLVQYLGKNASYEIPRKLKFFYFPAFFLIGLVFSNDLHQLVFRFPGPKPFSDSSYTYGPGYFGIVAWCVLFSLYFVVSMVKKSRAPGRKWLQKTPLFILGAAILLSVLYCLKFIKMDLTAMDCIIIILLLESCIQSGLIRSNSGYDRLFEAALIDAQILDQNERVCYVSKGATTLADPAKVLMSSSKNQGVILDYKRLNCADISNGKVLWWENIGEILRYSHQLETINSKLSEQNDLLQAELSLRENQLRIDEKNRLYDRITREVREQLEQLEHLLKEEQIPEEERIAKICVLSAYIKRRSNLCLLAEKGSVTDAKELEFCIRESLDSLRLCGILCSLDSNCEGKARTSDLILLYDMLQQIFQKTLADTKAILIQLRICHDRITLKFQSDLPVKVNLEQAALWKTNGGKIFMKQTEDTFWIQFKMEGECL